MDRPNVQMNWRKLVLLRLGYVDVLFSGLCVFLAVAVVLGVFGVGFVSIVAGNNKSTNSTGIPTLKPEAYMGFTPLGVFICMVSGIAILMAIAQAWLTIRLINSIKTGLSPLYALNLARLWRTITLLSTLISFLIVAISGGGWAVAAVLIAFLIVRGMCALSVLKIEEELEDESMANGESQLGPECRGFQKI